MKNLKKIPNISKKFSDFSYDYFNYLTKVFFKIKKIDLDILEKEFQKIRVNGYNLFAIGNGGGASTASALANDLGFDILKKTKTKKTFKIFSLTDNNAITTAISNDVGYDNLFINQLKIHYKKNDRLIIYSASGNSLNLIKAAKWAKSRGAKVIGIIGFNGGKIKKYCDILIHIDTNKGEYGPVEDIQLILNHILSHWFQQKIKK